MNNTQLHILAIDDNEDILTMLQAMLQFKGYRVTVKDDPLQIENLVKQTAPDIILMDMLLSGADGRELCRALKSNPALSHIPVIMLSAHPQARADCMAAGANYFIEKPFEMNEFFQIIDNGQKDVLNYRQLNP